MDRTTEHFVYYWKLRREAQQQREQTAKPTPPKPGRWRGGHLWTSDEARRWGQIATAKRRERLRAQETE